LELYYDKGIMNKEKDAPREHADPIEHPEDDESRAAESVHARQHSHPRRADWI
jgi:hypothetical protein